MLLSFRGFAAEFAGCQHTVIKSDWIEVEPIRPAERPELDEHAGENAESLSGLTISPSRAAVDEKVMHADRSVRKRHSKPIACHRLHGCNVIRWGLRYGSIGRLLGHGTNSAGSSVPRDHLGCRQRFVGRFGRCERVGKLGLQPIAGLLLRSLFVPAY